MKRRDFIEKSMIAGSLSAPIISQATGRNVFHPKGEDHQQNTEVVDDVIVEKAAKGQPHKGKILAAIQPHNDDVPIFAAGTVAKLIREGYTGYLIRTTNDDAAGRGDSYGERVLNNEKDNDAVAEVLGLKKVYNLNYRNHNMDEVNIQEIKGRLIFLFRLLKVDTIICYDPYGDYEENPDHYITARAVEAARWMAGSGDYPEQLDVVSPHSVTERYYFARGPQRVNRIVDISDVIDVKVKANEITKTQGPGGDNGARLKKRLADEGKRLPILGNDDLSANLGYIKNIVLDVDSERLRGIPSDRITGEKYGLAWAERFHYIGPAASQLDEYILKNSKPLQK